MRILGKHGPQNQMNLLKSAIFFLILLTKLKLSLCFKEFVPGLGLANYFNIADVNIAESLILFL